jgi:two-component system sensor histidine kinase RegB
MTDLSAGIGVSSARHGVVRLRTLIILRWLAILGQGAAIFTASQALDLDIPLALCIAAVGALVVSNILAIVFYPHNRWLADREVLLTLLFDLSQLALLVYLTGGLNNPFALLILAPVTVSAMTLRLGSTLLVGGLAVILISTLAVFHLPLLTVQGTVLEMPQLFVAGFWVSIMIGIVFLAIYAGRVTSETYSMSQALMATQMALAREQKLTDLGGVVAAAAHELGTPLATIKLASAELQEELHGQPDLYEDAQLISQQADRCRDILHSMGRAGKEDLHLRSAPLLAIIEEAAEPHANRGKALHIDVAGDTPDDARMPIILRKPEVIHGLRNLIQNAVDFAAQEVWLDASWAEHHITIRVMDDGPGYPVDMLGRIGDPFVRRRKSLQETIVRPEYEGMGLGLFIAKTLLERSGAKVSFENGAPESGQQLERRGAIAEVTWPTSALLSPTNGASDALGQNQPIQI